MSGKIPPYAVDSTALEVPGGEWLAELPWLGPREVAEAHPWPMLPLGGTPSVDLPQHIVDAVFRAAPHADYPGSLGLPALRAAIAERLGTELGTPIDPGREVLITVGSMQGLHLAATACTRGFGRGVAHAPSFFYRDVVAAAGGECAWAGGEDGPPDWDALASVLDDDVSAIFVNTPVNPTGYVFTEGDLEALARLAHNRNAWIISDEAYQAYTYDGREHRSPAAHPDLRSRTLVLRSFSKAYALGAWRVGFAAGPPSLIALMAKLLQYSVIGVPSITQAAALAAYTGPQEWARAMWQQMGETRRVVVDAVNATGFMTAETPQAGTTVWVRLRDGLDEDQQSEWLGREHGIPAVQGRLFGANTPHLRIPFAGVPSAVPEMLARLATTRSESTPSASASQRGHGDRP
jgi:aspartate/methionine/tyrosine aminotransferase